MGSRLLAAAALTATVCFAVPASAQTVDISSTSQTATNNDTVGNTATVGITTTVNSGAGSSLSSSSIGAANVASVTVNQDGTNAIPGATKVTLTGGQTATNATGGAITNGSTINVLTNSGAGASASASSIGAANSASITINSK